MAPKSRATFIGASPPAPVLGTVGTTTGMTGTTGVAPRTVTTAGRPVELPVAATLAVFTLTVKVPPVTRPADGSQTRSRVVTVPAFKTSGELKVTVLRPETRPVPAPA